MNGSKMSSRRNGKAATLRFAALAVVCAVGSAQAQEIGIKGTYGTLAMCLIDAFTDIPSAEINYNVGGAPLARLMPGEFDTPQESCVFQRIADRSTSASGQQWVVDARCDSGSGAQIKKMTIATDTKARSATITWDPAQPGVSVDQCSLSYPERLSREFNRLPNGPGKKPATQ